MNSFPRVQLRRVATIVNGGTPSADSVNWNGDVPWATPVDLGKVDGGSIQQTERGLTEIGVSTGSVKVPAGCVLLSSRAPIGYLATNRVPMAFNQGCKAIVPRDVGTDPRFLRYALESVKHELHARGRGSTFVELNATELAEVLVPYPSAEEQRRIADYLDHETAEIDALIDDFQRLLSLSNERAKSYLENRLAALGAREVELRRLRPQAESGVSVNASQWNVSDGEIGVLRTSAVSKGLFDALQNKTVIDKRELVRLRTPIKSNRVLVNRANTPALVGSAAYVSQGYDNLFLSDKIWQLDFGVSNEFMGLLLNSSRYREQVQLNCVGTSGSMQNLSYKDFLSIRVPVPEEQLQVEIVDEMRDFQESNRKLVEDLEMAILLTQERRAALISAAVTGKLDVTSKEAVA